MAHHSKYTGLQIDAILDSVAKKQNEIEDLVAIRAGAAKGATALQSYTEKYTGTVTGIKINGEIKSGSGVIDLGTISTDISGKVDKEEGKGLSTNDYTNEDKEKIGMILLGKSDLSDVDDYAVFPSGSIRLQQGYHNMGDSTFSAVGLIIERTGVSANFANGRVFIGLSDSDSENPNKIVIGKAEGWGAPAYVHYLEDYLHNIATQSEIDALFEGSSTGESSTSY